MKRGLGCLPFLLLPFFLFIDQPPLNVVHPIFERANMSNGPFLQLFEPLGNGEERDWNIQGALGIELRVERRGFS
jgi:hypothetical protein